MYFERKIDLNSYIDTFWLSDRKEQSRESSHEIIPDDWTSVWKGEETKQHSACISLAAIFCDSISFDTMIPDNSVISSYLNSDRTISSRIDGKNIVRIRFLPTIVCKSFSNKQGGGILLTRLFSDENWLSACNSPGKWHSLTVAFTGAKIPSIFGKNCIQFSEGEYPSILSSTFSSTPASSLHCH